MIKKATIWALFLLSVGPISAQFYTGSQLTFGRKRVQYETFFWSYYRFEKFDTYFNRNGKNLALYTASYVQNHLSEFETRVSSPLEDPLQFVIFNRLTDYKQSNIGYTEEEDYNTGGITKLNGNKVFLFFNGDYVDFERQIREGILEVLVKQELRGKSLRSKIRNTTTMQIPLWFEFGLVSYLSRPWTTADDDILREAIRSKRFKFIATLEGEEAKQAGRSLFRFIAQTYGESAVLRILHVTSSQRKVESAFKYALNQSFKSLIKDWQAFYLAETVMNQAQEPPIEAGLRRVRQKDRVHSQYRLNPSNDQVAYISNELGKTRVHLRDLKSGKHKIVFKMGYAINDRPDYTYPALAWHPSGEILAIAGENKGVTSLYLYNTLEKTADWLNLELLDKIRSISYSPNGRSMAISASQQGQSDIFLYNLATKVLTPITKDLYDDSDPRFLDNGRKIIFSSNRPSDTLVRNPRFSKAPSLSENHDLYIFDTDKQQLLRVTQDSMTNFRNPVEYEAGVFAFLTDESGVNNRALGVLDSVVASVDTTIHYRYVTDYRTVTDYKVGLREQDVDPVMGELAELMRYNKRERLLRTETEPAERLPTVEPHPTVLRKKQAQARAQAREDEELAAEQRALDSLQSVGRSRIRFRQATWNDILDDKTEEIVRRDSLADSLRPMVKERLEKIYGFADLPKDTLRPTTSPKQRLYQVEYFINETTTQVNFSFLNSSYQSFTGAQSPIFLNPGATAFLKVGASDLMENHRLIAGYRFSFDFSNNEYLLSYENLEKRLGQQWVFHRQAISETSAYTFKQINHNLYYILKYPLSEVLLLKGTVIGRMDKMLVKAADDISLRFPDQYRLWGGLKGELIFDHSRTAAKNIPIGSRAKVFFEYYQSLSEKNTSLFVLGGDYRHYTRIWRNFIWANRVAASTSFGRAKLIYYMGGVDDWLFPKFNNKTVVDPTQNYAYQTLATSMRGFNQNIRNGNNFVVLNSELRFPIISCLSPKPVNAQWLQNLQLIAFMDAGSAWVGVNPWSKKNALYREEVDLGDLNISFEKELSPFVASFGFGLRTQLFGYFIRIDRGVGVANGMFQKGIWHLSFGLDF